MVGFDPVIRALDRMQQRVPASAFVTAVIRKFGDDNAGYLAALLAYYAFFSLFPLLLLLVTGLGVVLRDNPAAQQRVLHSALVDFPIIGSQIQNNVHSLNRTGLGLAVGLVGTVLGGRGIAQTAQFAFNSVWAIPHAERPGFPWGLLRSLGLLVVIAAGVASTGFLSGVGGGFGVVGAGSRIAALTASALINSLLFLLGFRLALARQVPLRCFVFSAVSSALVWQALLVLGGFFINHNLRHASQVYGLFGLVLGLLGWLHLQAQITLYLTEIDVVRHQRLWPRGLAQPPLTPGDRRAYIKYARTEQRRPEEQVHVEFEPEKPQEPESQDS